MEVAVDPNKMFSRITANTRSTHGSDMKFFMDLFQKLHDATQQLEFSAMLRVYREHLGLMQYRAAEHMGMTLNRLRNLETGAFRDMPKDHEIDAIAKVYGIDKKYLEHKAVDQVQKAKNKTKVRILNGEPTPVLHLRKC